jgi:gliding motility-associated-like protein
LIRIFILIVALNILALPVRSQEWLWGSGGSGIDEGTDVAIDNEDGSIYTTGYFSANAFSGQLSSAGLSDGFLQKSTSTGFSQWLISFGGPKNDRSNAVAVDGAGNVYVAGSFTESATFGTFTVTAQDSSDIFIAKVNSAGVFQWVTTAGGGYGDVAIGLDVNTAGECVVTGTFRGECSFGSLSLTSQTYSTNSNFSSDIFIGKLNASGTWLWVKQGAAPLDDIGLDVSYIGNNEVVACGRYSEDLQFDQLHPSDVINAGFVVRLSSSGSELWFGSITASQVYAYSLAVFNNRVFVGGESIGQLVAQGTNTLTENSSWSRSVFITAFSSSGGVDWIQEDGSNSYVSIRSMEADLEGNLYATGVFECVFDEYSDEMGEGLFNSSGFKDVFVAKYSNSGNREWMGQSGGPRDDMASGIDVLETDNPVITGSFEKFFHTPRDVDYVLNSTNLTNVLNPNFYPNNSAALCGYTNYGDYITVESDGNKDVFLCTPNYLNTHPFDYYARGGVCGTDVVEPCIGEVNFPLNCVDTLEVCNVAVLWANYNTGSDCFLGPEYDILWNGFATNPFIYASASGTYSLQIERVDGCAVFADTVEVIINEPQMGLITDSEGVNFEHPPSAEPIELCGPAELTLTGTGASGNGGYWTSTGGPTSSSNVLVVDTTGIYTFNYIDENGCTSTNSIDISIVEPLDTIDPFLTIETLLPSQIDTLFICSNDDLNFQLEDSMETSGFGEFSNGIWTIYFEGEQVAFHPDEGLVSYSEIQTGTYTVELIPYTFVSEPCPIDTVFYPAITATFEVVALESPEISLTLEGDSLMCPGEDQILVATGAPLYVWGSTAPFTYLSPDSIFITNPGVYSVSSYANYPNGCSADASISLQIQEYTQPLITAIPNSEVICPGDSLLLHCESGVSYTWIGPLGGVVGTSQDIWVDIPGAYYCIQNTVACELESNVIEIQAYSTPYITGLPSANLCSSGVVTLVVQTSNEALIQWLPPLSGGGLSKNVFAPNVYSVQVTFCDITSTASIEVIDANPVATISSSNDFLCPGEIATFSGPPGMQAYLWTPSDATTPTILVSTTVPQTLVVTDTLGCSSEPITFSIAYHSVPTPLVSGGLVCYGDPLNLTATGSNIFWSTSSTGSPVVATGSVYHVDALTETYSVFAFADDGICVSNPGLGVAYVNPTSTVYISEATDSLCIEDDIELFGYTSGTNTVFYWSGPNGNIPGDISVTIEDTGLEDVGWYYLYATDGQCTSELDSVFIFIEDRFADFLVPGATAVCEGGDVFLEPEFVYGDYYWELPDGSISQEEVLEILDVQPINEGIIYLQMEGQVCAGIVDTIHLEVGLYPVFNLEESDMYCDRGYYTAHVPEGFDYYYWNTGSTEPTAVVPLDNYVWVEVTNYPGCIRRDSLYVNSIDCISEFPNIFTPNQDGSNDFVDFSWLRIPIDEVIIFNRWGTAIRHNSGPEFGWYGEMDNGEICSDGVYYYIVKSPAPRDQFVNTSGYIHIKQ